MSSKKQADRQAPAPSPTVAQGEGRRRARPRLWHHDYLHLRPLAVDLHRVLGLPGAAIPPWRVLDLGCGASPYREFFPSTLDAYVRVDLDASASPQVMARGESLPFADGAFEGVLVTQVLQYAADPQVMIAEVRRITRIGGRAWVTCHGAWPRSGDEAENRFGEPDLNRLFAGFERVTVTAEGGYLGLPFALFNLGLWEVVRAAQRRLGGVARPLWIPAVALFTLSNLAGRLLERLAASGPLRPFLSHLDSSLPTNYLVVAERGS